MATKKELKTGCASFIAIATSPLRGEVAERYETKAPGPKQPRAFARAPREARRQKFLRRATGTRLFVAKIDKVLNPIVRLYQATHCQGDRVNRQRKELSSVAKLKGPLFSLGASGAIGKVLVYFGWKGLDVAREYVIPANPKSTAQTTQRGYLTAVVAAIHAALAAAANPLVEADKSAYALWGSIFATPRTWFNQAAKCWLDVKVAVKIPCIYSGGTMTDKSATDACPIIYFNEETPSSIAAGKFYLGTSKTALIKAKVATIVAGVSATLEALAGYDDLTVGVKYFWQFRPDAADPAEGAISGIYYFVAE